MHFHCAIKTLIKWVQSPCNLIIAPFKIKCVALNSYFSWSRCTIKDIKINLRVLIHWLIDFIVIDGGRNDAVKHHRDSNMDILRKKKAWISKALSEHWLEMIKPLQKDQEWTSTTTLAALHLHMPDGQS